jgi:hypothetical protein
MSIRFNYTEIDDLSVRAKNIMDRLGGIENAKIYYKLHKNFLKIPKSGNRTSSELASLCEYLINEEQKSLANLSLQENYDAFKSSQSFPPLIKNCKFYCQDYDDLATRSKNVVNIIGGIEETVLHYKKYGNFINIQNVGNRTNLELSSFCEYLLKYNEENESTTAKEIGYNNVLCNIDECIDCYQAQLSFVSTRVLNYLKYIESKFKFNTSILNKEVFVKKYFINEYSFINESRLGSKSAQELYIIAKKIRNIAKYDDKYKDDHDKLDTLIFRKLSYKISKTLIEDAVDLNLGCFDFPLILAIYLNQTHFTKLTKQVLYLNYFTRIPLNLNEIANQLECSKVRVRQLIKKTEQEIIPNSITFLSSALKDIPQSVNISSGSEIIELTPQFFKYVTFDNKNIYENNKYFLLIYSILLRESYCHIDMVIFNSEIEKNSFVTSEYCFFISNKFLENVKFPEFINWIDIEIYNFELNNFVYDMTTLITRFYDEKEIIIEYQAIMTLQRIVEHSLRTDWSDIQGTIDKNKRKQEKESILELIYGFIKESNWPQKTEIILDFLKENYLELSRSYLLHLLGKNSFRFKRAGNGYWGISEFDNFNSGSLRSIIIDKLNKSSNPIHISEILEYVNTFHKTTARSIITNLKCDENNTFHFFNCSFIGLSKIKYDQYWNGIPKLNVRHLTNSFMSNHNFTKEQEIEYLSRKFGYPSIHLHYLFDKRGY